MAFLGSRIAPITEVEAVETYRNFLGTIPIAYDRREIEFENAAEGAGIGGTSAGDAGSLLSRIVGKSKEDVSYNYDETDAELEDKKKKRQNLWIGIGVGGGLVATGIIISVILVRRANRRGGVTS